MLQVDDLNNSLEPITNVAGMQDKDSRFIDGYRVSVKVMSCMVIDAVSTRFVKQIRSEMCPSSVARSEIGSAVKSATDPSLI